MLRRGEQYAMLHQAGGIAHARHVRAVRFNLEAIEIHAAKHDPRVRRRGNKAELSVNSGMESDALCGDRILDGCLEHSPT